MSTSECDSHSREKRENKNNEGEDVVPSQGTFKCHICNMTETYHYFGRKPPFKKGIIFLEDAFIAKDPFAPAGKGLFLLLGSLCSVCNQNVCQSQDIEKILSRKKK